MEKVFRLNVPLGILIKYTYVHVLILENVRISYYTHTLYACIHVNLEYTCNVITLKYWLMKQTNNSLN